MVGCSTSRSYGLVLIAQTDSSLDESWAVSLSLGLSVGAVFSLFEGVLCVQSLLGSRSASLRSGRPMDSAGDVLGVSLIRP